jgi:hypothetical protein
VRQFIGIVVASTRFHISFVDRDMVMRYIGGGVGHGQDACSGSDKEDDDSVTDENVTEIDPSPEDGVQDGDGMDIEHAGEDFEDSEADESSDSDDEDGSGSEGDIEFGDDFDL